MARIGAFPEPIVGRIAGQVLRGLVYLHKDRHLLHRDLKPSNILINARGEVKISDFGVSGQLTDQITKKHTFVGTKQNIESLSYSLISYRPSAPSSGVLGSNSHRPCSHSNYLLNVLFRTHSSSLTLPRSIPSLSTAFFQ